MKNIIYLVSVSLFLLLPILFHTLYPNPLFEYSNGNRSGIIQKLSLKGWSDHSLSYEGELIMRYQSMNPDTFLFTIPHADSTLANELMNNYMEKPIKLTYKEYFFVPKHIGNTNYLIQKYELIEEQEKK